MLDSRQAIIKHHVLNMQQVIFPRCTMCFILSGFNIPVSCGQFYNRIKYHNRNVTSYQLQQQIIAFLLCFVSHQTQHSYTPAGAPGFYDKRQRLHPIFCQTGLFFETALHQTFPCRFALHRFFQRVGCILQSMGSLVINSDTQLFYTQ